MTETITMRFSILLLSLTLFANLSMAKDDPSARLHLLAKMGMIGSDDIAYHQNQFREHKELSKIKRSIASIEPSIDSKPIYYRSNKPTLLKLD
jgi:hypothetical protein